MSEWISVDERLPEIREGGHTSPTVLVFVPKWAIKDYQPIRFGYWVGSLLNEWRIEGSPSNLTDHITHWMPLPDPPQQENGE